MTPFSPSPQGRSEARVEPASSPCDTRLFQPRRLHTHAHRHLPGAHRQRACEGGDMRNRAQDGGRESKRGDEGAGGAPALSRFAATEPNELLLFEGRMAAGTAGFGCYRASSPLPFKRSRREARSALQAPSTMKHREEEKRGRRCCKGCRQPSNGRRDAASHSCVLP